MKAPVDGLLLPHEACVQIGDRAISVVPVPQRPTGLHRAVVCDGGPGARQSVRRGRHSLPCRGEDTFLTILGIVGLSDVLSGRCCREECEEQCNESENSPLHGGPLFPPEVTSLSLKTRGGTTERGARQPRRGYNS